MKTTSASTTAPLPHPHLKADLIQNDDNEFYSPIIEDRESLRLYNAKGEPLYLASFPINAKNTVYINWLNVLYCACYYEGNSPKNGLLQELLEITREQTGVQLIPPKHQEHPYEEMQKHADRLFTTPCWNLISMFQENKHATLHFAEFVAKLHNKVTGEALPQWLAPAH